MRDSSMTRLMNHDADFAINPGSLASPGNDKFTGTAGSDTFHGGDGRDIISGLGGDDRLFGGDGRDSIRGGNGNDVLAGGAGRDLFIFDPNNEGSDRINDFENADRIRFVVDQNDANGPRQYSDLVFTEVHGGTQIAYGSDLATIFLAGVTTDQIDQSQFIFV